MPYSRTPPAFKDALLYGPDLDPIRRSLINAGLSFTFEPSGAKLFVWPEQYTMALDVIAEQDLDLHPSHVLIAKIISPQLQASIDPIASRHNVRVKKAPQEHEY